MAASPSLDESRAPPSRYPRRRLLGAVLAMHLAADGAIALIVFVDNADYLVALMLGFVFAQTLLAAVWTAWAPMAFPWRLGSGLLAICFIIFVLTLAIRRSAPGDDIGPIVYGVILLIQWALLQMPLWFARAAFGHRLAFQEGPRRHSGRELQFGVGQLLALTACIAVLLTLARWLYSQGAIEEFGRDWRLFLAVVAILAAFPVLAPLPAIWGAFASRAIASLTVAAVFLAALTIAQWYAFDAVTGDSTELDFFAVMNGSLFLVTAATLLSVRFCGYRLIGAPR